MIGLHIGQDRVADLLTLIAVLALEVGSALAGVYCGSLARVRNKSRILCLRIPVSQVRTEDWPEKRAHADKAASKVSCTISSAAASSRSFNNA